MAQNDPPRGSFGACFGPPGGSWPLWALGGRLGPFGAPGGPIAGFQRVGLGPLGAPGRPGHLGIPPWETPWEACFDPLGGLFWPVLGLF
jgi:hypothetical protein